MPHLHIETNISLDSQAALSAAKKASALCAAMLGKPEQYVQVRLQPEAVLVHGRQEAPAAYVELKSIGLPTARCKEFSAALCEFLESELGIAPGRVYIEFADIERTQFGWNKGTF